MCVKFEIPHNEFQIVNVIGSVNFGTYTRLYFRLFEEQMLTKLRKKPSPPNGRQDFLHNHTKIHRLYVSTW